MWMFIARAPRPDARHWPGRRMFALVDAVAWPAALAVVAIQLPLQAGLLGQVLLAMCLLIALRRTWRALATSQRYRFTSAAVASAAVPLFAVAALSKLAA